MEDILTEKSWIYFSHYVNIASEYFMHFSKCTKFSKPASDNLYLLINGLNTLTHIVRLILNTTLDTELALSNMQKAIYYYTPFIEQMEENMMQDLNISSNSASIFVYKKTISDLQIVYKTDLNDNERDFLQNIESLILIYRELFDLLAHKPVNEIIIKLEDFFTKLCMNHTDETKFKKYILNTLVFINHKKNDRQLDNDKKYEHILEAATIV
jgi:hypothetical protein